MCWHVLLFLKQDILPSSKFQPRSIAGAEDRKLHFARWDHKMGSNGRCLARKRCFVHVTTATLTLHLINLSWWTTATLFLTNSYYYQIDQCFSAISLLRPFDVRVNLHVPQIVSRCETKPFSMRAARKEKSFATRRKAGARWVDMRACVHIRLYVMYVCR